MSGADFYSSKYAEFRVGESGNTKQNRVRVQRVQLLDRQGECTATLTLASCALLLLLQLLLPPPYLLLMLALTIRFPLEIMNPKSRLHTTAYVDVGSCWFSTTIRIAQHDASQIRLLQVLRSRLILPPTTTVVVLVHVTGVSSAAVSSNHTRCCRYTAHILVCWRYLLYRRPRWLSAR